jgi:hypothetical protein
MPESAPFRLARRLEAIRRVLENPAPYAERLARTLVRETRRTANIALRYAFAPCRTNDYNRADPRLSLDAGGAAFIRHDAFSDSS